MRDPLDYPAHSQSRASSEGINYPSVPGRVGNHEARIAELEKRLTGLRTIPAQQQRPAGGGSTGGFQGSVDAYPHGGTFITLAAAGSMSIEWDLTAWNDGITTGGSHPVSPSSISVATPGLWHVEADVVIYSPPTATGTVSAFVEFYRDGDFDSESMSSGKDHFDSTSHPTGLSVIHLGCDVMFESTADFIYVPVVNDTDDDININGGWHVGSKLSMHLVNDTVIAADYS